jgi:hypothetical protein
VQVGDEFHTRCAKKVRFYSAVQAACPVSLSGRSSDICTESIPPKQAPASRVDCAQRQSMKQFDIPAYYKSPISG